MLSLEKVKQTMSDGGKGSRQRPVKDQEQFDRNWQKIFGKKKYKEKQK